MNIWRIIQILFPFCVIVPLGIYLYHYLRRSLLFWGCKPERLAKGIAALGALGLAVLALNLWGIGAIIVLYLAGVSLILDLIYRLTRKRIKAKGKGESIYRSGLIPVFVTLLLIAYGYLHMPLRYNNDKQKKPLFSRGLSVCRLLFNSFSKLKIDENYKEKRRLFY